MTKAELRERLISARRAHDTAIRALDRQWTDLTNALRSASKAEHPALIDAAARDMAPLLRAGE